jgi:hypothetical protein
MSDWDFLHDMHNDGYSPDQIMDAAACGYNPAEAESKVGGQDWGVAPWYYEQLAILYRKGKDYSKEVEILERYEAQSKAPGMGPEKLALRLIKARGLASKKTGQDT